MKSGDLVKLGFYHQLPPPLPTPLKLGERGAIFLNDDFSKASSQALEKSIPEVQQTAALFHF